MTFASCQIKGWHSRRVRQIHVVLKLVYTHVYNTIPFMNRVRFENWYVFKMVFMTLVNPFMTPTRLWIVCSCRVILPCWKLLPLEQWKCWIEFNTIDLIYNTYSMRKCCNLMQIILVHGNTWVGIGSNHCCPIVNCIVY